MNARQIKEFKQKALQWANGFDYACYLDSNDYTELHHEFDCLIAVGDERALTCSAGNAFEQLRIFYEDNPSWLFGFLSYELKNEIENLSTQKIDYLHFPDLCFFEPEYLISIKGLDISVLIGNADYALAAINSITISNKITQKIDTKRKLTKAVYLDKIAKIKAHILRGDIYELNFCQEFFAENAHISPVDVYQALTAISPTPFAGFLKINDKFILSATPERFLCKRGNRLISQPIKGTAKRSAEFAEDEAIKNSLKNSKKEQAENVMIVDLVRNDLAKSAVKGSVKVDELFGIYSFPQVHQMISTVSCKISPALHFVEAIRNTFPMGSMTGAPKLRAMQLIDEYEESKRGAYSGSFGYITPQGDFDFNVIIRSILYNSSTQYLSFQVGSAITHPSDAEKEYEECLLKASAMVQVLTSS